MPLYVAPSHQDTDLQQDTALKRQSRPSNEETRVPSLQSPEMEAAPLQIKSNPKVY